jgi:hypothetical protein
MTDYLLLMHDDSLADENAWGPYLESLRQARAFDGGSAIGDGICVRKDGSTVPLTRHLAGYIRLQANGIDEVRRFLVGNPVFQAGGTVEIRELPRSE